MNTPVSSLWSVQQHAWLRALGHTVWLYGSAQSPLALPKSSSVQAHLATSAPAQTQRDLSTSNVVQAAEEAAQASTVLPTPATDPLLLSLIRTSGLNPNQASTQRLIARWPVNELRASPAAKRAFWPQLRALRRQQRQG